MQYFSILHFIDPMYVFKVFRSIECYILTSQYRWNTDYFKALFYVTVHLLKTISMMYAVILSTWEKNNFEMWQNNVLYNAA